MTKAVKIQAFFPVATYIQLEKIRRGEETDSELLNRIVKEYFKEDERHDLAINRLTKIIQQYEIEKQKILEEKEHYRNLYNLRESEKKDLEKKINELEAKIWKKEKEKKK